MFQPEICNNVAMKTTTTDSRSNPGRKHTFTKDDLLVDTEPVAFDWNIAMEKTDKSLQRPNFLLYSKDDGRSEKPRRALSAYNIFFQHQREQIKKELAEASSIIENQQQSNETHRGKMLFAKLACTVATQWKAIAKKN